jgi:ankyrin repeat protein
VLLAHGAKVNAATTPDGATPLMYAAQFGHLGAVHELMACGASVNAARIDTGMTALMFACEKGHLEVVRSLLQHGADKLALNQTGHTARYLAVTTQIRVALD